MPSSSESEKHTVKAYSTDQARWNALLGRDPEADGAFLYGVTTTGVYCRPGCPSRLPLRDNVRFYNTVSEAERAGFRPCKRCDPQSSTRPDRHQEAIVRACRLIEQADDPPTLSDLAHEVGLSPSYLHRLFKQMVGVTPKQYASEQRMKRLRDSLQTSPTVTEAIYEAGFASSSRFYTDVTGSLGMVPTTFRQDGEGLTIRYALAPCSLGWALVGATPHGICAIDLADSPELLSERLRDRFHRATLVSDDPDVQRWSEQVIAFLDRPARGLDLPLDIRGTAFQRRVWMALKEIPPGATASYGEIAERIGRPQAARAVGGACAANPIAVAIPCHRVVRGNGALGNYRWGIERKRALLARERAEQTD